jgi:isocitrate lyase
MQSVQTTHDLAEIWADPDRWLGIKRNYSPEEVLKLRTSLPIEYSLARHGAERLWQLLRSEPYVNTFGAMTGAQAVQMVKAGLQAIYVSGWQVAADANLSSQTYPDQSLYPCNSVPQLVTRINNAFQRADQIEKQTAVSVLGRDNYAPIIADAEAGFGGPLHAFELMKSMIAAGAAGVHFEDQLAAEKKCGHLGGKVLLPASQFIRTLQGARLAADVLNVPTILVARTDALSATLLTSDVDPLDQQFLTGARTPEGFFQIKGSLDYAIARGLAYAPFVDLLWFETSTPDLDEAKEFAEVIHARYPGKLLAYNCSPSFNWKKNLSDADIARFQRQLGEWGYKFQFITLAGWHLVNYHTYNLARNYKADGMSAYVQLQEAEFEDQKVGYTAVKHQQEVGTGYFDSVLNAITQGQASTSALSHSTEQAQFAAEVH